MRPSGMTSVAFRLKNTGNVKLTDFTTKSASTLIGGMYGLSVV